MDIGMIFSVMLKLLAAMAIGLFLKKKKVFTKETDASLCWTIVNVTLPALVLYAVAGPAGSGGESVLLYFFAGIALYLLLPLVCKPLVRLMKVEEEKRGVYELMLVFANVSFMGIPVLQSVYGNSAVFYNSLLHMTFNLCIFTYGDALLEKGGKTRVDLKKLLTPGSVSCILAMVIYFVKLPVPGPITESLGFVGNVTTPLSMVVLGSMLAEYRFSEIASDKRMYVLAFLKLMVLPTFVFAIARPIWGRTTFTGMLTLSAAMPAASLCVMLANQKKSCVKEASGGVLITTLLSMATVPLWMLLVMNV